MNRGINLLFQVQPGSGVPHLPSDHRPGKPDGQLAGYLKPGDELPSVRQVASDLEVNQMTISKAYSLLEAAGVLERNRGRRMAVAASQGETRSPAKRLELIRPALMEAVTQANQLALPKEVVLKEFTKLLEEEK